MQGLIGQTLLKSIGPKEKAYEVRDTRLKGFLLRVQPTGIMTYYAEYARGQRIKVGRHPATTANEAREEAKKVIGSALKGENPQTVKKRERAHTLKSFIDEDYSVWVKANTKTGKATVKRIQASFSFLLLTHLVDIEPLRVEKWRTERLMLGRKPATLNRDLVALKACLAKAKEWGFISVHPLTSMKQGKVDDNKRPRFLTKEEIERLLTTLNNRETRRIEKRASLNRWRKERNLVPFNELSAEFFTDHLMPMVLLSLNTGMRRAELFHLTWDNVDMKNKELTVQGSAAKSGKTRYIPMNEKVHLTFEKWGDQTEAKRGLVFPNKAGGVFDNINTSWRKLLVDAKIANFRWHDIRHTFASWLVMSGVDLISVRDLLGHSDYSMTLVYAHLAQEHKAEAVRKLSF